MLANWVKQAVTVGGTGNLTLGSADAGHIDLNTAIGQGPRFPYIIEDGSNRETGIGYLSASTTLVREIVLETLASSTYDNTSPAALNVTTAAKVIIVASAASSDEAPNSIALDYDNNGYILDAGASSSTTIGGLANRLFVSSFFLPCRAEVSGLGCEVMTAAAGSIMLGIYQSVSRASAIKLAQIASAIDSGTTGVKTASLAASAVLNPGYYLMAMHLSAAPGLRSTTGTLGHLSGSVGNTGNFAARFAQAYTYGATMPASVAASNFYGLVASSPRQFMIGA